MILTSVKRAKAQAMAAIMEAIEDNMSDGEGQIAVKRVVHIALDRMGHTVSGVMVGREEILKERTDGSPR